MPPLLQYETFVIGIFKLSDTHYPPPSYKCYWNVKVQSLIEKLLYLKINILEVHEIILKYNLLNIVD